MDETYPFGEAFGPAMDRNQCIGSAQAVYHSLKKLSSSASAVPFSTITLSSVDENGAVDDAKAKAMMRVFRPDVNGELPLLAFIQCVDAVYRRYKFFRASVGNASVIDRVLENIINGVFFFVIGLMLLSFMQFNPWALLVSLTSLLVSVSFALGSSVSKYVEVNEYCVDRGLLVQDMCSERFSRRVIYSVGARACSLLPSVGRFSLY